MRRVQSLTIMGLLLVFAVGVGPRVARAGQQPPPPPATIEAEPLAIPDWLAWAVFHDSLVFYSRRSAAELEDLLYERVGLTRAHTSLVLSAGQAFVTAIQQIDMTVRADIVARYGSTRPQPDAVA